MSGARITVVLGPEWDDELRTRLKEVFRGLSAKQMDHTWGVGGSQELETLRVLIGDQVLEVEAETYIGLSLSGPVELVEKIQALM